MQPAHFHLLRRDPPLSMLKIKFSPFSLAKLARRTKTSGASFKAAFVSGSPS
jgi:hypothetical protein